MERRVRAQALKRLEPGVRDGEKSAFAKAIGKPSPWVSAYLRGTINPNLDTIVKIIRYLGLDFEHLTGVRPLPPEGSLVRRLWKVWSGYTREEQEMVVTSLESRQWGFRQEQIRAPTIQAVADSPTRAGRRGRRKHAVGG